ncbi:hypothetical protein PMAYCL1PPCAC_20665, partial [Pristionchus mayeri]
MTNLIINPILPNIEVIELFVDGVDLSDPRNFLLNISSHARDVQIDVNSRHGKRFDDIEYTELIIEMFSNKMDKLTTLDVWNSSVLPARLPNLGKKLWFLTQSLIYDLDYTINEHRVRAEDNYVSIKHIS